jgi:hypothetical protein
MRQSSRMRRIVREQWGSPAKRACDMSVFMISHRVVVFGWVLATAASFFTLGVIHAQRTDAVARRLELQSEERKTRHAEPVVSSATAGRVVAHGDEPAIARRRRPAPQWSRRSRRRSRTRWACCPYKAIIASTFPELNRSISDGIRPSGAVGSGKDSDIRDPCSGC